MHIYCICIKKNLTNHIYIYVSFERVHIKWLVRELNMQQRCPAVLETMNNSALECLLSPGNLKVTRLPKSLLPSEKAKS